MLVSLFVSALAACTFAAPSSPYVQHEKQHISLPRGWKRVHELPSNYVLPMRIALTQGNLNRANEFLMDVSHPESPNFGKHWTAKQVAETFAPSIESVTAVVEWLKASGIHTENISSTQSLGWLTLKVTVGQAEQLFKTKFFRYEHTTGIPRIGCDVYHVPEYLKSHVDFITPTVHFDAKIPQIQERRDLNPDIAEKRATSTDAESHQVTTKAAIEKITKPGNGFLPKKGASLGLQNISTELENCGWFIVPDCLRALYLFPSGFTANPKNSYGIVEYSPKIFVQEDLDLFFANFSKPQKHKTPIENLIDGAVLEIDERDFDHNSESDLDLEYAMTLINPQQVALYQVGDFVGDATFNDFLDAIDGSYCSYEGGDDFLVDPDYSNPFCGYQGPEVCGGFAATKVISTSYGYNEADLTHFYEMRQCNEYMKLGLLGTTVLYSSGDYGVAGNGGKCRVVNGSFNDGASGMFTPSFPGTCPYVTSVGATQIAPGASVHAPEEACETLIYSGGGFSNVFPMPSYQAAAVQGFLTNHPPPYTAAQYNNSGKSRGYPDISANGANYVVAVDGTFDLVYGTSASAPVVGAILTLINEARYNIGKDSIGFVNPTLYAHPELLNDITMGSNPGCGTPGFPATIGWDPVTGLGTPNFPRLYAKFLALP